MNFGTTELDMALTIFAPSFAIPTALDTPGMGTAIIESLDPEGPFGAKECGEGSTASTIPAIANAIYNATGADKDRIENLQKRLADNPEDENNYLNLIFRYMFCNMYSVN